MAKADWQEQVRDKALHRFSGKRLRAIMEAEAASDRASHNVADVMQWLGETSRDGGPPVLNGRAGWSNRLAKIAALITEVRRDVMAERITVESVRGSVGAQE